VAIADIDNDGYQDVFVGNAAGGLAYYKGSPLSILLAEELKTANTTDFNIYPNPANTYIYLQSLDEKDKIFYTIVITDMYGKQLYTGFYNDMNDKNSYLYYDK
jgi:hypothetical protein